MSVDGAAIAVPALAHDSSGSEFVLGARPEHIALAADAPLRASIYGAEYLGTTQIITLTLRDGTSVKARVPSELSARVGDDVGLRLDSRRLSLFAQNGAALRTALHDEAAHG